MNFFVFLQQIKKETYPMTMSDEDIIRGFRSGSSTVIRNYFYEYLKEGYYAFDRRYQLSKKQNLDFMSLSHLYALYLIERDWKPLEERSPEVSLKTWLIGGFRFIILDALKWYRKEYGSITFCDYLRSLDCSNDIRTQFSRMVKDVCNHLLTDHRDRFVVELILLKGYKGVEVAKKMGVSPAAVSWRYKRVMDEVVIPYFRKNFDLDLDDRQTISDFDDGLRRSSITEHHDDAFDDGIDFSSILDKDLEKMAHKRTTPEFITELKPGEIFVFGSNLRGIHGGGAARVAYQKFGAIWGEGVGLHGQSYGIPTMQGGVETIRPYVDEFMEYAKAHPNLTFLVTRIGCGIAGFTDDEISPLFEKAHKIENIVLPEGW